MTINLSLSINLTDLFGANASQTEQTLTIDKISLGLAAAARSEQILAALIRQALIAAPPESITTQSIAITANGSPLLAVDYSRNLTTEQFRDDLIYRSGQIYRLTTIQIIELTPYA
jgi:hypothetical protein